MPKQRAWVSWLCVVTIAAAFGMWSAAGAETPSRTKQERKEPVLAVARQEQPALSAEVERGLSWLVAHQLRNGAWGQGDESQQMGGGNELRDQANVADTSMAVLALVRAGHTPSVGTYREAVRRGMDYVLSEIERADADSLFVTEVRGTRVQSKIGAYVDTFAALNMLTELKGRVGQADGDARVDRALTKVLHKVERNQREDGSFDDRGWAPVLSQSLASKGLNKAARGGRPVAAPVLERAEKFAQGQVRSDRLGFTGEGSAGVDLYAGAAATSSLRESVNTRRDKKRALEEQAQAAARPEDREEAARQLAAGEVAERSARGAEDVLLARLDDPGFVSGFGSNGGEEFLSYMLVSESLVVEGGEAWKRWSQTVSKLLGQVQNADGSWTGHHCITGRTFCTAAALLVLMADRMHVSDAAKLRGA